MALPSALRTSIDAALRSRDAAVLAAAEAALAKLLAGTSARGPQVVAGGSQTVVMVVSAGHAQAEETEPADSTEKTALPGKADLAEAWRLRALLALRAGQPERARGFAHQAVGTVGDDVSCWRTLAECERATGRWRAAVRCWQRVAAVTPEDPGLLTALGEAHLMLAEPDPAVDWLRRALAAKPEHQRAWFFLAQALREVGSLSEAQAALARVLSRQPANAGAFIELGRIHLDRGQLPEAHRCFERALTARRTLVTNRVAVAHLYARSNEVERAASCYREVLAETPGHAEALEGLAFLLRKALPAGERQQLEARLADPATSPAERARLHYAQVEIALHEGDTERVVAHARTANALQAKVWAGEGRAHDRARQRARVDGIIETFTAELFAERSGWGVSSERPVFIVGLPRSGTSLVEQVLSSHPAVFGGGELLHLGRLVESATDVPALKRPEHQRRAHEYLHRLCELSSLAARVTDKLPFNFLHVGWIELMFPRSTVIYCRRDPRDVAVSCFTKGLARVRWSADLEDITSFCEDASRLLEHWQSVLPERLVTIDYEQLIAAPEVTTRRMIEACRLPWDPACLAPHQNLRAVRTASTSQVRELLHGRSVGRWREYRELLAPTLERLTALVAAHPVPAGSA